MNYQKIAKLLDTYPDYPAVLLWGYQGKYWVLRGECTIGDSYFHRTLPTKEWADSSNTILLGFVTEDQLPSNHRNKYSNVTISWFLL